MLNIESPDEIDLELIAASHYILVREEHLTGAEARLVRTSRGGVITVRSDLEPPGRKRFAIAHELGHFFLHPDTQQLNLCAAKDMSAWSDGFQSEEAEANAFAAELLMPSKLFEPLLKGRDPSFDLICELANRFRTTLTASALQFVKHTKESCVLIFSDGKTQTRYAASSSFSGDFKIRAGNAIHPYTCACELIQKQTAHVRANNVPAGAWLEGFSPDGREVLTEDSFLLGPYGIILSLVWVSSDI
jgi:hypothetical protein